MGRTVSLPMSLRITMGMLVTGSIMSPRIFISTSIVKPLGSGIVGAAQRRLPSLYHHFSEQTVRKPAGNQHRHVSSYDGMSVVVGHKIRGLVLRSAADPLLTRVVPAFNHYFNSLAHMSLVAPLLNFLLASHADGEAARFFFIRDGVFQVQRRSVGTR